MKKDVQICVVGKVFKPNRLKVLALNKALNGYHRLVGWYLSFNSTSKGFLHENGYRRARLLYDLHSPLIQTARDKAVKILRSFERRCYSFSETINVLTRAG